MLLPAGIMRVLELTKSVPTLQQHTCVIPEAVIQFRCSWWWAKISLETCGAVKEQHIILHSCILLVIFVIIVSWCTDPWLSSGERNLTSVRFLVWNVKLCSLVGRYQCVRAVRKPNYRNATLMEAMVSVKCSWEHRISQGAGNIMDGTPW